MKILINIGHPAHVHYFRNFIEIMGKKGHEFHVIAKNREMVFELLNHYKISFVPRKSYPKIIFFKLLNIPFTDLFFIRQAIRFKPDLMLSFAGTFISHTGFLLGIPSISLEDTDNAKYSHTSYVPFITKVITPECFGKDFGHKHIRYRGYTELLYLHPNNFKPDVNILREMGLGKNEKYAILRFVSWSSNHDIGHKGIRHENKIKLVNQLSEHCKLFISSEKELPDELKRYSFRLPPHKMHDAMAFASLLYGESATMASEAAMMGVPAIFVDNEGRSYTNDIEDKYGLIYNYSESEEDQARSIQKAVDIISGRKGVPYAEKRNDLIAQNDDITSFLVSYIENFESRN